MINGENLCSEMVLLWADDSGVMLGFGHGEFLNAGPHMILKGQTVDIRPWPYLNITFLCADCLLLKLFCNVMFFDKIKQNKTFFFIESKIYRYWRAKETPWWRYTGVLSLHHSYVMLLEKCPNCGIVLLLRLSSFTKVRTGNSIVLLFHGWSCHDWKHIDVQAGWWLSF